MQQGCTGYPNEDHHIVTSDGFILIVHNRTETCVRRSEKSQATSDRTLLGHGALNNNNAQKCVLCVHDITPDYKNVKLLSQFQSPYTGCIYGRHITGLGKERQQQVEAEIRKAQNAGLMATYLKEAHYLDD